MATISGVFDVKLIIYDSNSDGELVASFSKFATTAHPATNKLIEGWHWDSRTFPSEDNDYLATVPTLHNPVLSGINNLYFQSGIGSDGDLEVISIEDITRSGFIENWAPLINHGYFYQNRSPGYLYSDAARTEYPSVSGVTTSGYSHLMLKEYIKNTAPIKARKWKWNSSIDEYELLTEYDKKVYFTGRRDNATTARLSTYDSRSEQILWNNIDTTKNEFVIINSGNNKPYVIFDHNVHTTVGNPVVTGANLLGLELIGVSSGVEKQSFHTQFSPIDKTTFIQLFTYPNTSTWTQWNVIQSGDFTHIGNQVKVDPDLGIFYFGAANEGNAIPVSGHNIAVRYTTTAEILYEPEYTTDHLIAIDKPANVNPLAKVNNRGFVILKQNEVFPSKITLSVDLPQISLNLFGPQDIGAQYLKTIATVTSKKGELLEGFPVTFYLLDNPSIGKFTNGLSKVTSITNENGQSFTYYTTPRSIDDISEIVTVSGYSTAGGNTTLQTNTIKLTTNLNDIFLYKIWKDDPLLGIDLGNQTAVDNGYITSGLQSFYQSFFADESIFGVLGNDIGTGLTTSGIADWEHRHRIINGLLTPKNYNRLLRNGRKQIVSFFDTSAIDPHFNEYGALRPLQPTTTANVSGRKYNTTYNGTVLTAPGTGDLDAYLLISPCDIQMIASVYDEVNDVTIYSNTITVRLHIPDYLNGTVNITNVNLLPSGIVPYILNNGQHAGRVLPLGWRLKSNGDTFASAIGGVTYIDINPKADMIMSFNVDIIV